MTEERRPGLVLGRYELLVPIASGGMAQVWAARLRGARSFQKILAVKTMLPKLSEDPQFEQMFLDEASLASQVRHPNAVETLDLGEEAGILYLVMEWIEGVPLNQLMKAAKERGGIPFAIAARIAMQACAGLHAAHELRDEKGQHVGLVHRDVSPQNLLVTYDGVTKVVDFGVAKATALGGGATVAGQVKGKVSYMAPEQVQGEGLDRRADVFALGIVLYALTTGKHPFRRESEAATMFAIVAPEPVIPPSRVIASYPAELEPIVLRALEKDRNARFASCDEMLRALDALPSHLRVGSDADVATFVRSLFESTRIEQRQRIEAAIEHVESSPFHQMWPAPPTAETTGRVSLPSNELSGIPTGIQKNRVRNRVLGGLALGALAVAGGVLFQALVGSTVDASATPTNIDLPDAPLVAPPAVSAPTVSAAPPAAAVKSDEETAPLEAADLPVETKKTPSKGSSTSTPTPPKKGPAKGAQDWKFDAGF